MSNPGRRWSGLFAILCIALGTAAVSMVLNLLDATLWRPLPYPQSQRLVRVWLAEPGGNQRIDLSIPEFGELERELGGIEILAGAARSRMVARLPGGPERLRGEAVDADYFELLGIRALQGRLFAADDHATGGTPVALISHALWRSRFAGADDILRRSLDTADASLPIVGVLPPGFDGTVENDVVEYWVPLAHYAPARLRADRAVRQTWTLARLARGETLAMLNDRLAAIGAAWRARDPVAHGQLELRAEAFGENWREPLRRNAGLQLAAVVALLLIAIANVVALLLARALDRRNELALRAAIGADRSRLMRLLLGETVKLALLGGILGALAAPWLLQGLLAIAPLQIPSYIDSRFDLRAGVLVAAILSAAAAAAAMLPAWIGSRVAPNAVLAGEGRGSAGRHHRRLSGALVAAQIALSFVLLAGGALLVRSYLALASLEVGYRSENLLRMAVTLSPADIGDPGNLAALYPRISAALRAEPGIRAIGLVSPTLPPWDGFRPELRHPALALQPDQAGPRVGGHAIDPQLLDTLGIALHAGRGIEAGDSATAPRVALVSAALANRLGGADRVLGTELELGEDAARPAGSWRIVGVVADVGWDGVGEQDTGRYLSYDGSGGARFDVYTPLAQAPSAVVSIAAHTATAPAGRIEALRQALARVAPYSAVHWVSTMEDELAGEYAASRFYLTLVLVFGVTALLLSAVGLFALLTHVVLARSRELGIRQALGADVARIARLVLGFGLRLLATGLLAGLAVAAIATRLLGDMLYGVSAFDPLAYAGAALVLAACALLACAWPLRRAISVPATEALRGP